MIMSQTKKNHRQYTFLKINKCIIYLAANCSIGDKRILFFCQIEYFFALSDPLENKLLFSL